MESYCLMGTEFMFGMIKKVLQMDVDDGCTTVSMYLTSRNCTLKTVKM